MPSFDLTGRVAVVTGGYGTLGSAMAAGLADAGARIAILGRNADKAEAACKALRQSGAEALPLVADALDEDSLRAARDTLLGEWGRVDALVNAAGGNVARARTDSGHVFGLPFDAFERIPEECDVRPLRSVRFVESDRGEKFRVRLNPQHCGPPFFAEVGEKPRP